MQVELRDVVSAAAGVLSVLMGAYVMLLRYAISQREKELDNRIAAIAKEQERTQKECGDEMKNLVARLAEEEKATIRQKGEMDLVRAQHEAQIGDIEEIKRTMLTRTEFEPRMTSIEKTLREILAEMRGSSSRYYHGSQTSMPPVKKPDR